MSFMSEGIIFIWSCFSLESDLSFSFLNLSRMSLNLVSLRWLLFLFSSCLISCLVSPASSAFPHIVPRKSAEGLRLGRSVRLSLIEMMRFLDERERMPPRAPFSSYKQPCKACSFCGSAVWTALQSLMFFLAVGCSSSGWSFLWLRADRMSLLRLRSLQLRLRFCLSRVGVAITCISDCYGNQLYKKLEHHSASFLEESLLSGLKAVSRNLPMRSGSCMRLTLPQCMVYTLTGLSSNQPMLSATRWMFSHPPHRTNTTPL